MNWTTQVGRQVCCAMLRLLCFLPVVSCLL